MCGRARCTLDPNLVAGATGVPQSRWVDADRFRASYNVSPGRYMPVLRICGTSGQQDPEKEASESKQSDNKERIIHCMKWGLVPSFTKTTEKPDHFRMFNARSESLHEKSSFRRLLPHSRCVAMVEGFFEWKKDEKSKAKQPYYIHLKDDNRPLFFAGLYDRWEDAEGQKLHTFTIVTTRVSKDLSWLHDRMPVILGSDEAVDKWLKEEVSLKEIKDLAEPYEGKDLVWHPVTPAMGRPDFDGPEVVKEVKPTSTKTSAIAQLFKKAGGSSSVAAVAPGPVNEQEAKAMAAGAFPDHQEEPDLNPSTSQEPQRGSGSVTSEANDKSVGDNFAKEGLKGAEEDPRSEGGGQGGEKKRKAADGQARKEVKSPTRSGGRGRASDRGLSGSAQKGEKQKTLTSFFKKS